MACLNWLTGFNGEMYLRGHGVEKNAQKAELWAHQVQTKVLEMNRVQLTSALHCM